MEAGSSWARIQKTSTHRRRLETTERLKHSSRHSTGHTEPALSDVNTQHTRFPVFRVHLEERWVHSSAGWARTVHTLTGRTVRLPGTAGALSPPFPASPVGTGC